ncbi:MAG: penicillin acylase family protein [Siphonobacter aquaeclarae]|nr:penicillin acylase family protein [Siphonobacter aquaeclarae]
MKWLKRILFTLLILVVVAVAAGWLFLFRNKTPNLSNELSLPGLKAPVEAYYDDYGIPHIYAENEEDLFYAFGYVHAQDRLFQMEMLRRLADGRLSEVFGAKALPTDRFFRTLSFRHYARQTINSVYRKQPQAPFVKAMEAYVKGINAYISTGETPLDFELAKIPKTPFTVEDVEIIQGYMGYGFAEAFRSEAVFTTIAEKWGPAYLKDMAGDWPVDEPMIPTQHTPDPAVVGAAGVLAQVAGRFQALDLPYPPYHGSNGWVISGKKTRSGKPILSNDTHIGFAQPSVWYEAHLNAPGFNFYGSFLAGTPFGALGHSDKGGWGLTMFENDDVDFYREKANPQNPGQVWFKDHWENLSVRKETIHIKDSSDVALDVRESRHGILIHDVFDGLKDYRQQPIALWWTYYKFPSRLAEAFYGLAHSSDATEAAAQAAKIHAPGLNIMWGDTKGNIAWWAVARLPKRPAGVRPYVMLDGSTGNDDPVGWYDFSQNPQILNPPRGVLYSANNQPADMGNGLVPGYYVPGDRARRIEQLIFTDKKDWTPQEVRKVINDVTNPEYPLILKDILPLVDRPSADADLLARWSGAHELASTEPTLFYKWIWHIYRLAIQDELGETNFLNTTSFKRNMASFLRNDASPWWDNVHTPAKETRKQILNEAFKAAVADLEAQLGTDRKAWNWEKVHTLEHKHPISVASDLLGRLFNVGPYPVPGGRETINNLDFHIDSTGLYKVTYGPALRRIVDFADPLNGTGCLPTGQSGVVSSEHYKDQAELFVSGEARPELMNKEAIVKVAGDRKITFRP